MTEKATYTPGPWSIEKKTIRSSELKEGETYFFIVHLDGSYSWNVCIPMGAFKAETEANARLIAACPELIKAAKEIYTMALGYAADQQDFETCRKMAAVIAKAEGRQDA